MAVVGVQELLNNVRNWESEKVKVQANYFMNQMETCTVVGTASVVSDSAISIWNESGGVRVDLAKSDRIARATPGQLEMPTGAQMVQGIEFDDHYWVMLHSGANFLIGKLKAK
ncbi:hypothetical protein [Tunturiibacter lichenicola]|jgi:hypothetical protein|uniref:hypothetical protein n=1 Tax=Tunturiibacter lichenicola TaxID=2051959 RepID=UPI003D9B0EDA